MVDGLIRILRLYCRYNEKTVAESTGISLQRYKRIEIGEEEPTEDEIVKIAAVFGVNAGYIRGDEDFEDCLLLLQPAEDLIFASEEIKEKVKLTVTQLSELEKKLILLIRCSENSEQALLDAINTVLETE